MTISVERRLSNLNERPTGFDYLRLALSCAVICMHSVRVSYGSDAWVWASPLGPFIKMVLPMFFAMGGFLIASSLQHCKTVGLFIGLRIIRIYPALICEVMLSALILGIVFTTDPLKQYFTNREFLLYVLNVTGYIHFFLPGVFLHNPDPGFVNVQLWTVPPELKGIFLCVCLMFLGVKKRRILAPIAAFAMMFAVAFQRYRVTDSLLLRVPNGTTPETLLLISLLFGICLYLYKDRIPYNFGLFALSLVICLGSNDFGSLGVDFNAPFLAYVTVYIGLRSPKKISILQGTDYSYAIYLYGYPLQQAFAAFGKWTHHWYLSILFCLPMAWLFAIFSWKFVEKPALGLRSQLKQIENFYLARKTRFQQSGRLIFQQSRRLL